MTIRRVKGTGSIRKMGKTYYWRITINGEKIVKRLDANTEKEANLEAIRLYAIASAKTQEEVALFAGRAREVINENFSILLKKAFAVFKSSPSRPVPIKEKYYEKLVNCFNCCPACRHYLRMRFQHRYIERNGENSGAAGN